MWPTRFPGFPHITRISCLGKSLHLTLPLSTAWYLRQGARSQIYRHLKFQQKTLRNIRIQNIFLWFLYHIQYLNWDDICDCCFNALQIQGTQKVFQRSHHAALKLSGPIAGYTSPSKGAHPTQDWYNMQTPWGTVYFTNLKHVWNCEYIVATKRVPFFLWHSPEIFEKKHMEFPDPTTQHRTHPLVPTLLFFHICVFSPKLHLSWTVLGTLDLKPSILGLRYDLH